MVAHAGGKAGRLSRPNHLPCSKNTDVFAGKSVAARCNGPEHRVMDKWRPG
jgi:hypothetical protein